MCHVCGGLTSPLSSEQPRPSCVGRSVRPSVRPRSRRGLSPKRHADHSLFTSQNSASWYPPPRLLRRCCSLVYAGCPFCRSASGMFSALLRSLFFFLRVLFAVVKPSVRRRRFATKRGVAARSWGPFSRSERRTSGEGDVSSRQTNIFLLRVVTKNAWAACVYRSTWEVLRVSEPLGGKRP